MSANAGLLSIPPGEGGFEDWSFLHGQDHANLTAALNIEVPSAKLDFRILDPVSADITQWLLDHQRSHDDLSFYTGVTGSDLTTVDFDNPRELQAWIEINWQEHIAFAAVLGL